MYRLGQFKSIFIYTLSVMLFITSGCGRGTPVGKVMPSRKDILPRTGFGQMVQQLTSTPVKERGEVVRRYLAAHPVSPAIEHDSLAVFFWYGKATSVLITGDYQGAWRKPDSLDDIPCGSDTLFVTAYSIPSDARLDYQLIVDGATTLDPRNPRVTPSGFGPHSEIAMPRFNGSRARTFHTDIPHGTIDSLFFVPKDTSIKARQCKIYKPAGYARFDNLPSLYILDGVEAMAFIGYTTILDNLIAENKIDPLIVIFVPPVERNTEFLLEKDDSFSQVICSELVPSIDKIYRTDVRPERRGITGISSGGHCALRTLVDHPDVFLLAAGQSSTISEQLLADLDRRMDHGGLPASTRLYFDVGRYDLPDGSLGNRSFLEANEEFHKTLETKGLKHLFHVVNDGHQWASWRERTEEILIYFFRRK